MSAGYCSCRVIFAECMCKTEYVLPLFFMPEAENKNIPPETFAKMFQGECWRFIGLYHGPWRLLKGSSVELEGVSRTFL